MNQPPPTKQQLKVLSVIVKFIGNEGYAPTRAEVAKLMGFASPNAAQAHMKALAKKGFLHISKAHRSTIVLKEPKK